MFDAKAVRAGAFIIERRKRQCWSLQQIMIWREDALKGVTI
jgi:hypothetical protein